MGENTIQSMVRNERDRERVRDGTEGRKVRHVSPFLLTQRLSSVAPLIPRFALERRLSGSESGALSLYLCRATF